MNDPQESIASSHEATVAAYERYANAYVAQRPDPSEEMLDYLERFVGLVAPDGPVLEVGSGPGFEAVRLRARGLEVRPTDVTPAFVDILRRKGFDAALLDPAHDDLGGPYAGVLALACLLHVPRAELASVLSRLREATVPGGALAMTLKDGDGEGWSTHGAVGSPRWFTYWRAEPLRETLTAAGWHVEDWRYRVGTHDGRDGWHLVLATCP